MKPKRIKKINETNLASPSTLPHLHLRTSPTNLTFTYEPHLHLRTLPSPTNLTLTYEPSNRTLTFEPHCPHLRKPYCPHLRKPCCPHLRKPCCPICSPLCSYFFIVPLSSQTQPRPTCGLNSSVPSQNWCEFACTQTLVKIGPMLLWGMKKTKVISKTFATGGDTKD